MFYKDPKAEFVNTSEAYSSIIFLGIDNIVIPYINIGLMPENSITGKAGVVDYSYYILSEVQSVVMMFESKKICINSNLQRYDLQGTIEEHLIFGGYRGTESTEVIVYCNNVSLFIPDYAKFSDSYSPFSHMDTPNYKQNMDSEILLTFFKDSHLPKYLQQLLGKTYYSISFL